MLIIIGGHGDRPARGPVAEIRPGEERVYGEVNQWLLSEYGLGWRNRSLVQEAAEVLLELSELTGELQRAHPASVPGRSAR